MVHFVDWTGAGHIRRSNRTGVPRVYVIGPAPGQVGGIASVMSYLKAQTDKQDEYDVRFLDTMRAGRWSVAQFVGICVRLCAGIIGCKIARQQVVVHLNVSVRGSTYRKWFISKLCRLLSAPYLVHLHGGRYRKFFDASAPVVRRMIFGLALNAARVVVLGTPWRDFVIRDLNVDPNRVAVVRNGTPNPGPYPRRTCTSESKPVRIVFCGRLDEKKGLSDLLEAADSLYGCGEIFELVLMGDSRDPLLLQRAQARPYCQVKGWLSPDEVTSELVEADVFTLPSHDEGLPMAMLEAMSLSLPVVVTAVGAIPDVVRDGQEGFLIQPQDTVGLEHSLRALISSPHLRDQMGGNAQARWQADLDAVQMTRRIVGEWKAALISS